MTEYKRPSVCKDGDEIDAFLNNLVDDHATIESYSAAVRYCVRQQMKKDQ